MIIIWFGREGQQRDHPLPRYQNRVYVRYGVHSTVEYRGVHSTVQCRVEKGDEFALQFPLNVTTVNEDSD